MTWLVFGVSCLLVLAGAISIVSGAPIIQLERGWAEVISGTVALSSGGVVFALAGILMRLESIRDTMAARMMPLAAERLPSVVAPAPTPDIDKAPLAAPAPAAQPAPPAEAEASPASAREDDGKTEGLWKRVKRPGPDQQDAERPDSAGLRQHGFPDRVVPDESPPAPPTEATRVLVPAHAVPENGSTASVAPSLGEAAARDAVSGEHDTGQIGWLERSLFKGRTARSGGDATPSLAPLTFERPSDRGARVEPSIGAAGEPSAPRQPLFPAPEPKSAAEPAPTPDLASEQQGGATVVGRYQAGSASYVMYSDGTIEVETESGEVHRFGSMDELKAFIAQQDSAVS